MLKLPKNEYRISITSGCNMKCVYCHNEGNCTFNQLSKDEIEELIKNSYDLGLESVRITGGEPLIHKDIFNICKMLSEEYHLKVGINTNLIEIDKLMYMIEKGWIYRVVVGLDYYDGEISKQSPVGISSKKVLENILRVKNKGINISISTVFNGDYENLYRLFNWSLRNGVRIKILEQVKDEIFDQTSQEYAYMRNKIMNDYNLEKLIDSFNQWHGKINNQVVVSFFHSHCRLNECDICKNINLRVTGTGKFKQCIQTSEYDVDIFDGDIRDNIINTLNSSSNFEIQKERQEKLLVYNNPFTPKN